MKSQIATTASQSQRLLDCGVSADTADMCYDSGALSLMDYHSALCERNSRRETYEVAPAWSLSALLTKVFPNKIVKKNEYHIWLTYKLKITTENSEWCTVYESCEDSIDLGQSVIDVLFFTEAPDPIEACVLMAEKLTALYKQSKKSITNNPTTANRTEKVRQKC